MTTVPSIGTESITLRIASTATWSDLCRSPWPIVCAQAMAACSTTRRNSSERSASMSIRLLRSMRGQLAPRRTVDAVAEEIVGLHDFVNFACAFVNDRAFAIAIETADRVLVGITVGAMDLNGVAGGALGRHRGKPLGQPGLAGVPPPLILEPARSQPEQ